MFDSLDDVLGSAFALLAEGAADPGSAWRNVTLATLGLDGTPQARTVVLRGFDRAARVVEIHTDLRSAKHAEILAHPEAALHGWDTGRLVQLRLACAVTWHSGDDVAGKAWDALRPQSRATYAVRPGPGTVLSAPDQNETNAAQAQAAFCVVRLELHHLDWLHLGRDRHRRARFDWAQGACRSMWLVP